jgi:hypothetical protein
LAWIQVVVGELHQASGAGQSNSIFDMDIRRYLYDDDDDMTMIKLIFYPSRRQSFSSVLTFVLTEVLPG